MKLHMKIALATGVFALSACSMAIAGKPEGVPPGPPNGTPNGNAPEYTPAEPTPGPKAGLPAQAKAYGRYCKGEKKVHVKGEQGTAFSRCVKAMAKAAHQENENPTKACKGLSKKHVKGEKGTAFSRCVKAAAKLHHDQENGS